jgi:hypothetical protein
MRRRHRTPYHVSSTPWPKRSRRQQRQAWVALRWRIRQDVLMTGASAVYQGRHVEDDMDNPWAWQWTDIIVPDPDGHTIWNMALVTVRRAGWDQVDSQAYRTVQARLTEADRATEAASLDFDQLFQPLPRETGQPQCYEFVSREDPQHASLGGLTVHQAQDAEVTRVFQEAPLALGETWTLHRDYGYGIGVHARVAAHGLDRASIEAFVARFLAVHGQPPVNPEPAPAELQATQSAEVTYAALNRPPLSAHR